MRRNLADSFSVEIQITAVEIVETTDQVKNRRFAGAIGTHDAKNLAFLDRE